MTKVFGISADFREPAAIMPGFNPGAPLAPQDFNPIGMFPTGYNPVANAAYQQMGYNPYNSYNPFAQKSLQLGSIYDRRHNAMHQQISSGMPLSPQLKASYADATKAKVLQNWTELTDTQMDAAQWRNLFQKVSNYINVA